jgi:hypothetical protein
VDDKIIKDFDSSLMWCAGLLVEYNTWEKIATVLHRGKIYRVAARDVQKSGKRQIDESW